VSQSSIQNHQLKIKSMSLNEYFANLASDTGANEFSLVLDHAASWRMEIWPISGRKASFEDTKFSSLQCDKMPSRPERSYSGGSFFESCIEEPKSMSQQINGTIDCISKSTPEPMSEVLYRKMTRRNSYDSASANMTRSGTQGTSIESSLLLVMSKESRWRN
jgi:hypothetical protein